MTKIETKREFPGMSTGECYKLCVSLIDKIGYKIFKKRDIANLIICKGMVDSFVVDLSLMVPLGSSAILNVNLSSDGADDSILLAEANRILKVLSNNM